MNASDAIAQSRLDLGSVTPALFLASGDRDDAVPTYQQVQITDSVATEFLDIFRLATLFDWLGRGDTTLTPL
jgi:hypothetical protein